MNRMISLICSIDRLSNPQQIAVGFCILLIDAVTFQLLWPSVAWIFGSGPEAMWGIASPNQRYASDWFFQFFYWTFAIGLFSLWALPGNQQMSFYRWFALWIVIWGSQKLLGVISLGYILTIIIFNDGCPTYQVMGDDGSYGAECIQREAIARKLAARLSP